MKKLFAVLFIALAFACNSDDDNNNGDNGLHNPYTGDVLGTWKAVALFYEGDEIPLGCESEVTAEQDILFTFNADNTFTMVHNCGDELPYDGGTYTKTGNVLTLIMGEGTVEEKAHMVEIVPEDPDTDFNELVLEWRFKEDSGGIFDNFDVRVQKQ